MKKFGLALLAIVAVSFSFFGGVNNAEAKGNTDNQEKPITIYLVRHGKTWFNTTGQVQGFADTPLTDVGIDQAKLVGGSLADVKFSGAYSSDLGRQRSTAQLILAENNKKTPTLTENNGFREKNFGGFEGQTNEIMWNTIMTPHGLAYKDDWSDYPALVEALGGEAGVVDAIAAADETGTAENFATVQKRGLAGMKKVIKQTEKKGGGNVLIVSSGGMIPILLEEIVPGQYQGEDIGNCSITTLSYQAGKYTLEKLADTSHLDE